MNLKRLLIIAELLVLGVFIYWHFKLGLVRFFDGDEFAHMHWGYSFFVGERPYTDFFYLFPPFFLYPIAALFKIFGRSAAVLINARMLIFFVFLSACGVLFLLIKKLKNINIALLTVVFFAFLPIPFDKLIEVRPDLLATVFALLGLLLFMRGYEGKKQQYYFLSGLSYAVSLGFVPKTIFFLVPVGLVIIYRRFKDCKAFFLGFLPAVLVLFLILLSFGNLAFSLYSMTRMAQEVTKVLGSKFYMLPNIFFYPNDTYYGFGGWSLPLAVNLIIYICASVWAVGRLVGSLAQAETKKSLREFLVAGSFFANFAAFVYFYPLKHAQYLIPVAPFIAFYAADMLITIMNIIKVIWLRTGILLIVLAVITTIGFQMNQRKETWVNKPTFDKINYFLNNIPKDVPVFDLTGESIFFRNGYYFCCLPYGQYEEALYFRIPDIGKEMQKRGTRYVYLGAVGRLNAIPAEHAKYILDNFVPVSADKTLLIRK